MESATFGTGRSEITATVQMRNEPVVRVVTWDGGAHEVAISALLTNTCSTLSLVPLRTEVVEELKAWCRKFA